MLYSKRMNQLRYIWLLFVEEFLQGASASKKRFVSRITQHVISLEYVAWWSWRWFICKYYFQKINIRSTEKMKSDDLPWYWSIEKIENNSILASWIKHRYDNGPKIIVIGTGSLGDALQMTPLLRALHHYLPTAEICLLHKSKSALKVLKNNPYLKSLSHADFDSFSRIKKAVKTRGFADLVIEVESVTYLVSYVCAPMSLQHKDLIEKMPTMFFDNVKERLEKWRTIQPFSRNINNLSEITFAPSTLYKDIHFLDLMSQTSGLSIDRFSSLDFQLERASENILNSLPKDKKYITVQNGVDPDVMKWGKATQLRPTKMLPLSTWKEIVYLLSLHNFNVVQIGLMEDELIDGVLDLRGTTIEEAAQIIRHAKVHLGTEGGLVHLARAVATKSVVLFGPTPSTFLGYPQNMNLTVGECSACWRAKKDWFIFCPQGFHESLCMQNYEAPTVVKAILKLISS